MTVQTIPARDQADDAAVPTSMKWLRAGAAAVVVGYLVLHSLQPADLPATQVDTAAPADAISPHINAEPA